MVCFRLPLENHNDEDEGIFEMVEVVEDFRDSPIMGILLFSLSFSALLVGLGPCGPREDIFPAGLRMKGNSGWTSRTWTLEEAVFGVEVLVGSAQEQWSALVRQNSLEGGDYCSLTVTLVVKERSTLGW